MASDLASKAKEAFIDDHFELAVDFYSQAIAVDPNNPDLFSDRAQANIKLKNFTEAVADANKAIDLDSSNPKAYLRKGTACFSLEEYQTAKAAFEAGFKLAQEDTRFTDWIKKCDKFIAEENGELLTESSSDAATTNVVAPTSTTKDADEVIITPPKPKYRHEFYQKPEEVVVTIFAKGIPANNVSVNYGEQILSVTIDVPGEDSYILQPRLFGKIVPEKCRFDVLSTKIEIRLAKAEPIHWTSLEFGQNSLVVQRSNVSAGISTMEKTQRRWRKVAYGGMQPGFDDNHTDDTFLQEMVMNANVVKRDMLKVMLDSVSISQYLCIVALVVLVWTHTLNSTITLNFLLVLDITLVGSGFFILLLTANFLSFNLLFSYAIKILFFTTGLYVLSPIYHTLTRSISSDSIWALTTSLVILHLFLHNYSGSTIKAPGALENPNLTNNISLNASIVASLLIASRLPSRLLVFAIILFSLQVFLFAPLVAYCLNKYSFRLHLFVSFVLMAVTLTWVYWLHKLLFVVLLGLLVFVNLVCPYRLIRIQEYKFEINGPWDEAKLCFNITD